MGMPALTQTDRVEIESIRCDLSRYLSRDPENQSVRCVGTHVSRESLRLVSYDQLEVGAVVSLHLGEQIIRLTVSSCRLDTVRSSVFHLVIKTQAHDIDLYSSLESAGLLHRQAPRLIAIGDSKVSLEALRGAVAHAGASDASLLRIAGEQGFAQKAYPIDIQGLSVIVLLPAAMATGEVLDMPDDEIFEKIVILARKRSRQGDSRWVQAFPHANG